MKGDNSRILQDEQEIKELQDFIEKVYFKQNEKDLLTKQYYLDNIKELEEIAGDDDFPLHLSKIYTKIVQRQKENLAEFEGYSSVLNNQRLEDEQQEKQVSEALKEQIDEKYQNIAENIIDLQSYLTKQELVFRADPKEMDQYLNEILIGCKVSRQDYERRREEEKMNKEIINEEFKINNQNKEEIIKDFQRNSLLEKEQEANLMVIKEKMDARKKYIKAIEEQQGFEGQMTITEKDQEKQEQIMQFNALQRRKEQFDEKITRLSVKLADYTDDNRIIEKRFQLGGNLFSEQFSQQMQTLKQEEMELVEEIKDLKMRLIAENTRKQQQLAQDQLNRNSISKNQGKNIQLLLYVIIALFIIALIFKWF